MGLCPDNLPIYVGNVSHLSVIVLRQKRIHVRIKSFEILIINPILKAFEVMTIIN